MSLGSHGSEASALSLSLSLSVASCRFGDSVSGHKKLLVRNLEVKARAQSVW